MPRNAEPLVFSVGDVLRLLDKFFPHGERPVAVRQFMTSLEHARQARDEGIARATAEFDQEFLRTLGDDDEDGA